MKEENISPLLYFTKRQKEEISKSLANEKLIIDFAMRYGNPSIKNKISNYKNKDTITLLFFHFILNMQQPQQQFVMKFMGHL